MLVVLGLVLGMTMVAAPVAAKVSAVTVGPLTGPAGPDTRCAGALAQYVINFTTTAILHTGSNHIFVEFPADTAVTPTGGWDNGDIQVSIDNGGTWDDVFGLEVEVTGTTVKFMVPVIVPAGIVLVRFNIGTLPAHGIRNPTVPGTTYKLKVWTDRPQDATPVSSASYTIYPKNSAYKMVVDFGPTYDDIAPGFIPPLQACVDTAFNLSLFAFPVGCLGHTCPVTLTLTLLGSPDNDECVVDGSFNGTAFSLDMEDVDDPVAPSNVVELFTLPSLAFDFMETWEALIHLECVCWHDLVFELWTECADPCDACTPVDPYVFIDLPFPLKGLQWLYAYEIDLFAKWNLISIPFAPWNPDSEYMLGSYGGDVALLSVWNYDATPPGTWIADPDEIVDGKAYWMRFYYGDDPVFGGPIAAGASVGTWWVFGTLASPPIPPAYPVYEGWNMVGFTTDPPLYLSELDTSYLWNWAGFPGGFDYGMIYGWDATTQLFAPQTPGAATFDPGDGYWIPFEFDGYIYP